MSCTVEWGEVIEVACRVESGPTERYLGADQACDLLARLTEEAERTGDMGLRSDALDAWDRLLESGHHQAALHLEELWRDS